MALPATPFLKARSCSFRVIPTPRSLSDSRAILRLLQRIGEVSAYKWFKYNPRSGGVNSGLVVYRDQNTATEAMARSPLFFWLVDEPKRTDDLGLLKAEMALRPSVRAVLEEEEGFDSVSSPVEQRQVIEEQMGFNGVSSPVEQRQVIEEQIDPGPSVVSPPKQALSGVTIGGEDELTALSAQLQERDSTKKKKKASKGRLASSSSSSIWQDQATSSTAAVRSYSTRPSFATPADTGSRQFKLVLEPWRGNLKEDIVRTKFYNPYNYQGMDPMQVDLAKKVPMRGISEVKMHDTKEIMNYRLQFWERKQDELPRLMDWVREKQRRDGR